MRSFSVSNWTARTALQSRYRAFMLRHPRFAWRARSDDSFREYFDDYRAANRVALLNQLHAHRIGRIFEFGCYSGPNLRLFAETVPTPELFGVDINPKAIAFAKAHLPTAKLAVASDRSIRFLDRWVPEVDLSLAFAVFYVIDTRHVERLLRLFRQRSRLILIGCNASNYHGSDPRRWDGDRGLTWLHPWQKLFDRLSLELLSTAAVPKPDRSCQQTFLLRTNAQLSALAPI
jgi:SAM-dependent methyltransferase